VLLRGQRGLVGHSMILIGIYFHCLECLRVRTRGVGVLFVGVGRDVVIMSKALICCMLSCILLLFMLVQQEGGLREKRGHC